MSARVGVLARSDDRGIGIQTWEAVQNLQARPLVIRHPRSEAEGFPSHHEARYPGELTVEWGDDHRLPEDEVRDWLTTVDVIYSVESLVDARIAGWAREHGVATVVHANPELWRGDIDPTEVWLPTPWRSEYFPVGTPIVPVPVDADAGRAVWLGSIPPATQDPIRILHVVGRKAAHDRNGTGTLMRALRFVEREYEVTIHTQERQLPAAPRNPRVTIERRGPVADRWEMYRDQDLLVLPRKYGGLCLPAQEAMAAGLALAMPATPPNGWYRAIQLGPVLTGEHRWAPMPCGDVALAELDPRQLAKQLDAIGHQDVHEGQQRSLDWVTRHRWGHWHREYLVLLEAAADKVAP